MASAAAVAADDLAPMAFGKGPWVVEPPLFTVGQSIGDYTPPGILDGLGAYELDDDTVRVLANHELPNSRGYPYEVMGSEGPFSMEGARVSYFDIDKATRKIKAAGIAYSRIYDANGNLASEKNKDGEWFLKNDFDGFSRFCSSQLVEANEFGNSRRARGIVDMIYFTGEEDGGTFNSVGGAEWALDVGNQALWAVPAMGRGAWENITQVDTRSAKKVAFILADDTSPFDVDDDGVDEAAPLFLYIGEKDPDSTHFLERNGLHDGKLYVWVADRGITSPAEFNGDGEKLWGSWREVDNSPRLDMATDDGSTGYDEYGYPTQRNLWAQAEDLGAFGFSRPEDVATNPANGRQAVMASTGVDDYLIDPETGNGVDTFGTVYIIDTRLPSKRTKLTILYDGDADPTRALRSPDNLDWADDGFIYVQEDEAEEDTASGDEVLFGEDAANPDEAGIVRLHPRNGAVTKIAEIDRDVVLDASPLLSSPEDAIDRDADPDGFPNGEWESSGILDVATLFGEEPGTLFLFDVQAHGIEDQTTCEDDEGDPQPCNEGSRIEDGDLVEGGQLLFLSKDD
jgi:hypothetical protein